MQNTAVGNGNCDKLFSRILACAFEENLIGSRYKTASDENFLLTIPAKIHENSLLQILILTEPGMNRKVGVGYGVKST